MREWGVCGSVGVEGCRFAEGFQGDMGIAGDEASAVLVGEVGIGDLLAWA